MLFYSMYWTVEIRRERIMKKMRMGKLEMR